MDIPSFNVSHIFDESSCFLCGKVEIGLFLKVSDNFIKYKGIFISLIEIIRKTLDLEICDENSYNDLEICNSCETKLVSLYNFKMRAEECQKLRTQSDSLTLTKPKENRFFDEYSEDKLVYNTLQIVRNYIEKYSVSYVEEDENEQRLIIKSKSPKDEKVDQEIILAHIDDKNEGLLEIQVVKTEEDNIEIIDESNNNLFTVEESPEYDIMLEEDMNENEIMSTETGDETTSRYDDSENYSYEQHGSASEYIFETSKSSRRPRRPESWECNKRKTLRNLGLSYKNVKGKIVEARRMRESCGTACRNKCGNKITQDDRQRAFDYFWGFGDVVKQRKFIYEHIETYEPKRHRTNNPNATRSVTLNFFLEAQDEDGTIEMVKVCKKMFKNTLVVSSQVIQGVVKKYASIGFQDSRGKFKRKVTQSQQLAIEHVKKFPFFYLEKTMTKIQCYQMYREECEKEGLEPVKEGYYRDIFDKQNQGSFLKTETILCSFCHNYNCATDEVKQTLQQAFDDHIKLGANKKCRDRALGRIRHKRAMERKKAIRLETIVD